MSKHCPEYSEHNPTARLESFFSMVWHTRMEGLPILNPALVVEAVGFQPWDGGWLGIMITPWFMNLLWVPDSDNNLPEEIDTKTIRQLPAGQCEFTVCQEEELGKYLCCYLFSPMTSFPKQDKAHNMASEIVDTLFIEPEITNDEAQKDENLKNADSSRLLTRRDLLRGAFSNK